MAHFLLLINEGFGRKGTILAEENSDKQRKDKEVSDEPYTLLAYRTLLGSAMLVKWRTAEARVNIEYLEVQT